MNKDIALKLSAARTALLIDAPFFGELCLRLRLVERPDLPPPSTFAVDGRNIFYNPAFVDKISSNEVKFVLAHEVMHCVYEHMSRRGDRNPKKWNIAGDYSINGVLIQSGFTMPKGGLYEPAFDGKSADEIYSLLPDPPPDGGGGSGPGPLDQVMDGTEGEAESIATEWKIATIQAANSAKMAGKLPESLKRLVDELITPKVDWRDQLRRFITEKSRDDYTWMRPNRRYAAMNLFLPSLYSETMGRLVVAIDTSGSISDDILQAFGSEIKAAHIASRPSELINIYCDARVNHVDTFGPSEELHFDMHGGGSTDFNPPFGHVDEHNLKPACFIYLTDGYGPFPPSPPDYPVLWVMTTDVTPPWGEVIRIQI
jgi:predicted metal-dependent peptidase